MSDVALSFLQNYDWTLDGFVDLPEGIEPNSAEASLFWTLAELNKTSKWLDSLPDDTTFHIEPRYIKHD